MPENIVEQPAQQANEIPADLKNMMDQSLANWNQNGAKPTPAQPQLQEQDNEQPKEGEQQSQEQVQSNPDPFNIFKEKFGYTSPEDALKEIEELRGSRERFNAPTSVEDIEFENADSEKLYKAVVKGDRKEVYRILEKQERLDALSTSEINASNAAEVIKYGMQLKYPSLSQKEIDWRVNKQYATPNKPVHDIVNESEEQYAQKMEEWKAQVEDIEMTKIYDAKILLPELESAKAKLVLPDIVPDVDEEYEQYKQLKQNLKTAQNNIVDAYKTFTPDTIGMKLNLKDEANKVDINFDYKPDEKSFKQTLDVLADFSKFFELFNKPDGTPDREAFAQAIHFALNRKDILNESMKQAKNGTMKRTLPDNNAGGLVRQLPSNESVASDLDALMKQSLAVR